MGSSATEGWWSQRSSSGGKKGKSIQACLAEATESFKLEQREDLTLGRNCHWRKAKELTVFETVKFASMEIPQIYNRREAEQLREKWLERSAAAWSCHGETAERQRKVVRELPHGLLKKHCYKRD